MENINTKLHESRAYDKTNHTYKYLPLTDAQREEMTETQITKWEAQAKKGLMKQEYILQSLASNLRMVFNGIMKNNENIVIKSGVTLTSKSAINSYAATLASQFGITGTKSFSLKGTDGVTRNYSFDTAAQSMNDVVNAINADTSASGITAVYSTASNTFSLATVDNTQNASLEIVSDGDLFLKDTLKLGVNAGIIRPATNILSGDNVNYLTYRSLSSIGLETTSYSSASNDNGKVTITESTLRAALQNDASGVMKLFNMTQTLLVENADGTQSQKTYNVGIGLLTYDALTKDISLINSKAGSGDVLYDNSYISQAILRLEESVSEQQERLKKLEDRYYAQFTAMEKAIQKANAQSAWLSQQLGQSSNSSS